MSTIKTIVTVFVLIIAITPALTALEGEVVTVNGKVEYQNTAGAWKPLNTGDSISSGTMISTGFRSNATIRLGASILTVKPLTRMTLTNLTEKEEIVDTEVYLEVGRVKAEVNSYNKKRNGFSVRSPVATASVRGTVFEMGNRVYVQEGVVEVSNPAGQKRTGKRGQQMDISEGTLSPQAAEKRKEMKTIPLSSLPSLESDSPIEPVSVPTSSGTTTAPSLGETSVTITIN